MMTIEGKKLADALLTPLIVNGTTYSNGTPLVVANILEAARQSGERLRLFLGDQTTGKGWLEEWDVIGRIGRSMGPKRVPLLIHSSRSHGGGAVLTACIVRIVSVASRREIYRHPLYRIPDFTIMPAISEGYSTAVWHEGQCHAQFRTMKQAERWIAFMRGERFSK